MSKGRVVEVERVEHRATYIHQGVKKHQQNAWSGYPGGNGTYVTGGEYLGVSLNVKVFVYDLEHCVTFDIRDAALGANGCKRISNKLLAFLKQNEGEKVKVAIEGNQVRLNPWDLPYFERE